MKSYDQGHEHQRNGDFEELRLAVGAVGQRPGNGASGSRPVIVRIVAMKLPAP